MEKIERKTLKRVKKQIKKDIKKIEKIHDDAIARGDARQAFMALSYSEERDDLYMQLEEVKDQLKEDK